MTRIKTDLILASKNAATGDVLYTFRLTFPRIILAETLTHRAFSRNTSSTRAIPTIKMIKTVIKDMFVPSYIGVAQKGMQAGGELTGLRRWTAKAVYRLSGYTSAVFSYVLYKLGVAKQIAGRLVEPYSWVTQIVSTTDINNFLHLRNHDAAEPHLHELAAQIESKINRANRIFKNIVLHSFDPPSIKINGAIYQILHPGEWHLPFIMDEDQEYSINDRKKMSAARCARTSYTLIGSGKPSDWHSDMDLCEKLFGSDPKHLSPTEHQAEALYYSERVGNFKGFKQFRKEIENG